MFFWSREKVKKAEIENWIENKYSSKIEDILNSSGKYMEKIEKEKQEIKKNLEKIKFKEPNKNVFKKIYKSAMSSRDKFIKSLSMTIEKAETEYNDIESLKKTHQELVECVNSMQKYMKMHGKYLNMVYEDEMKEINKSLRGFVSSVENIGEELRETEFIKLEGLMGLIREKKSKKEEIKNNESSIKELENKIENADKKIQDKEKELSNVKGKIKKEKKKSQEEKNLKKKFKNVENKIYSKIAPLKREMRKLDRIVAEKKLKKQIQDYRDSPVTTFLQDSDLTVFKKIVPHIEEMETDEHKREKTLNLLNYILEGNLENEKRKYKELKEKIDSFEVPHKARDKRNSIKREIKKLRSRIVRYEKKIEEIEERNDLLREEIDSSKEEIIDDLEEHFDVKVQE